MDEINRARHDHIFTLEDPIEYVIPSKGCHVTQREVHTHTKSFANALRGALREDPDVIMVGEMRDLETISLAITASETGHLVLGTLHTANAARTLDRVLDVFPVDQREQIRIMVSESLRGIISQQLVPRADNKGRALRDGILMNTPAVANIIARPRPSCFPASSRPESASACSKWDDSLIEALPERPHHRRGSSGPRRAKAPHAPDHRHQLVTPTMAYIDQFFKVLIEAGASDLHLAEEQPPKIRRHGEIVPIREEVLSRDEVSYMLSEICSPKKWEQFEQTGDLDFAYEMDEDSRFRCNFLKQGERLRRRLPPHPGRRSRLSIN